MCHAGVGGHRVPACQVPGPYEARLGSTQLHACLDPGFPAPESSGQEGRWCPAQEFPLPHVKPLCECPRHWDTPQASCGGMHMLPDIQNHCVFP